MVLSMMNGYKLCQYIFYRMLGEALTYTQGYKDQRSFR